MTRITFARITFTLAGLIVLVNGKAEPSVPVLLGVFLLCIAAMIALRRPLR